MQRNDSDAAEKNARPSAENVGGGLDWLDESFSADGDAAAGAERNGLEDAAADTETVGRRGRTGTKENGRKPAEAKVRYNKKGEPCIFQPFTVKDIVFLAIVGAAALVTSAVMPLVKDIPVFGLPQIVTGLQMSVFPTVGLMKVRKTGSIFIMVCLAAVFEAFMAPAMAVSSLVAGLLVELVLIVFFRGMRRDAACFTGGMLLNPMTLPFYYLYCMWVETDSIFYGAANAAPWIAAGVSAAVVALCALGALIGVLVSRELRKAGILNK